MGVSQHLLLFGTGTAELGDSSSDSGRDKTKKKRCTLCKKRVGLTGLSLVTSNDELMFLGQSV